MAIPYWVGEAFKVKPEIYRRIALANIFGLQHFVAQDDLIDGSYAEGAIPNLAISGSIYLQQMFLHYQHFFPSDSPFWEHLDRYWLEWASSNLWEREASIHAPFNDDTLLLAARKAAPLKICTTGLALLGDQEDRIPELDQAIDLMHMVMQMADDLVDIATEVDDGRFNVVLNILNSEGLLDPEAELNPGNVGRLLFTSGYDQIYLEHVSRLAENAQEVMISLGFDSWATLVRNTVVGAYRWRDERVEEFMPSLTALFTK